MRTVHVLVLFAALLGVPAANAADIPAKPTASAKKGKAKQSQLPELLKTEDNYLGKQNTWRMPSGRTVTSATNKLGQIRVESDKYKIFNHPGSPTMPPEREIERKATGRTDTMKLKPGPQARIYKRTQLAQGYEQVLYYDKGNNLRGVIIDQRNGYEAKELSDAEVKSVAR
jgi:hypothetical protein